VAAVTGRLRQDHWIANPGVGSTATTLLESSIGPRSCWLSKRHSQIRTSITDMSPNPLQNFSVNTSRNSR
jgi:hypothetical protein